jgi:restriction endonuclease S subunit
LEKTILRECVKRGATVHSIDVSKLQQIKIPFTAKSEQLRIANILDQADTLRKKRAQADIKTAQILPALFYRLFGDPLVLAWIPMEGMRANKFCRDLRHSKQFSGSSVSFCS